MKRASEKRTRSALSKKSQNPQHFSARTRPSLTNTPDYSLVIIKVMWGIIRGKIVSNQQGRFSNWLDKIIRTKTMRAIILCWQRGTLDRLIDLLRLNLVIYRWLRAAEE